MSLTRQFLREFRPLFRMLEEPFGRPAALGGAYTRHSGSPFSVFNDPFFNGAGVGASLNVPAIDVSEEPNAFVVEAELPGVKKENVDLRIGDNGQSLTIEGRTFVQSKSPSASEGEPSAQTGQSTSEATPSTGESQALTQTNNTSTQLSTERTFTGSSSFSRTVWLPRRVDGSAVSAKLSDGILTVRVPKAEDQESVKVNIE